MSFKKPAALLAATIALAGCSSISIPIIHKSVEHNVLSGREGINGPVLAVKVDDTNAAHPQIGLEDADVIYIEQVEGGLTRLAAIFSSTIPMRIGPVRSARISDIDILRPFGHIAFAYSGAQKKLLPVISAAYLQNLGAQSQSPTIYTTDPTRTPPVAMVLRADLLMAKTVEKAFQIDSAQSVGWSFGDAPKIGKAITGVTMHWPAARYEATWSKEQSRWLLWHNAQSDLAQSGQQLGATTLVIELVSITPSQYHDKFGGVTPFSQTVGSGKGYVLRDGISFEATWSRSSVESGTTWTGADGSEIKFAPGQVWVALTDTEPDFAYVTASADALKTK